MSDREQLTALMSEARQLVTRLGEDDRKAESLVKRARSLVESASSMRDYQKSIEGAHATTSFGERRKALLGELQRENREILALQEENRSLKEAMEECLGTLETVMARHRQVVSRISDTHNDNVLTQLAEALESRTAILKQSQDERLRFRDMAYSLLSMLEKSEQESETFVAENARLRHENGVLREVLALTQMSDPKPTQQFRETLKQKQTTMEKLENGDSDDSDVNRTVLERPTLDATRTSD